MWVKIFSDVDLGVANGVESLAIPGGALTQDCANPIACFHGEVFDLRDNHVVCDGPSIMVRWYGRGSATGTETTGNKVSFGKSSRRSFSSSNLRMAAGF